MRAAHDGAVAAIGRSLTAQEARAALVLWGECVYGGSWHREDCRGLPARPAVAAGWARRVERVVWAVDRLDERVRRVLWLRFGLGLGYEQARRHERFPRAWDARAGRDAPLSKWAWDQALARGVELVAGMLGAPHRGENAPRCRKPSGSIPPPSQPHGLSSWPGAAKERPNAQFSGPRPEPDSEQQTNLRARLRWN